MGTAAIAGGGGTAGAGGTARVAVSDCSVAIKAGAGIGAGAFIATASVTSIAAFGSGLTVAAVGGTADGSTHVGVGTSVTWRSSASKRLSRQGKSRPGSPSPSLPKLRLNSNACISKESSTAVRMGLRSRNRSGMRGIFLHIESHALGHLAQMGGANDPRQVFRALVQTQNPIHINPQSKKWVWHRIC